MSESQCFWVCNKCETAEPGHMSEDRNPKACTACEGRVHFNVFEWSRICGECATPILARQESILSEKGIRHLTCPVSAQQELDLDDTPKSVGVCAGCGVKLYADDRGLTLDGKQYHHQYYG